MKTIVKKCPKCGKDVLPRIYTTHGETYRNFYCAYPCSTTIVVELICPNCECELERDGDSYEINDVEYRWYKCPLCNKQVKVIEFEPEN